MTTENRSSGGPIHTAATRLRQRSRTTWAAIGLLARHPAGIGISIAVAVGYLVGYLWAIDLLSIRPGLGVSWMLIDDPLSRLFDRTGPINFEPIALLDLWVLRVLVAPIDLAVGGALAVLAGLNLGLAYLAIVQPKACGIGAGSGLAAAVPALLSGSACCAPVIAIVLGIQLSGTLLTVLPWLLPIGAVLLLASLLYVGGLVGIERAEQTTT